MFDNVGATNGFYSLANQKYLTLSHINDEHEFVIYGGEGADPLLMKTYPTWATHGVDKPHQRFMTYIKDCVVHPEGGKFAAFYSRFKRFRMFDDAGHLLRDVDVRIEPFSTDIAEDYKEQWVYYTGTPQLVGDCIYVICVNKKGNDSKPYRSELQVWDWEGEPVACYELDTPVSYFSISPTHQKLYVYNHETEDELYVYDLPRR